MPRPISRPHDEVVLWPLPPAGVTSSEQKRRRTKCCTILLISYDSSTSPRVPVPLDKPSSLDARSSFYVRMRSCVLLSGCDGNQRRRRVRNAVSHGLSGEKTLSR